MATYLGVDDITKVAVSGAWGASDNIPSGQTLVLVTDGASQGWTYENGTWTAPVAPTVSVDELRVERDKLLRSSDFTQLADSPHKTADKVKWATYRQSLRDLPEGYTPVANPVYPVRP